MRALRPSRLVDRLEGRLFLPAAWLLVVIASGGLSCASAPSSNRGHADASPSLESGPPDEAIDADLSLETGSGDEGLSPETGSDDAGAPDSSDASGSIAAKMNDVSILFPLPSSAADVDHLLAASATGSRGALLPSGLYASMGPIAGSTDLVDGGSMLPPHPTFAAYGDLRVVAMRIDPCFGSLTPDPLGAGCTAQIRLVFQEVLYSSTGPFVFDSALHAFYDLSRTEFLALARALVALRVANENGEPLGPLTQHPIMVRQGLSGAMSQGVQRLILEYAGEQNVVRTAQSSVAAPGFASFGVWVMSAFDANGAPLVAIPRSIPTLMDPADGGSVFIQSIAAANLEAFFNPATMSADNFTALWKIGEASAGASGVGTVSPSDRQAALDALVRVENPKDNSPQTIDCASCHMATVTERIVAMPLLSFDDTQSPLAFQPDGTNVTLSDMGATYEPNGGWGTNIHVFSYAGTSLGISQRVVNETAAVVEYLNHLPQ